MKGRGDGPLAPISPAGRKAACSHNVSGHNADAERECDAIDRTDEPGLDVSWPALLINIPLSKPAQEAFSLTFRSLRQATVPETEPLCPGPGLALRCGLRRRSSHTGAAAPIGFLLSFEARFKFDVSRACVRAPVPCVCVIRPASRAPMRRGGAVGMDGRDGDGEGAAGDLDAAVAEAGGVVRGKGAGRREAIDRR